MRVLISQLLGEDTRQGEILAFEEIQKSKIPSSARISSILLDGAAK